MILRGILFSALLGLVLPIVPAHAVRRPIYPAPDTDTLSLDKAQAHAFFSARRNGEIMNDAGALLGVLAIPMLYAAGAVVQEMQFDNHLGDGPFTSLIFVGYAYLPMAAVLMAQGNRTYARAAAMDGGRQYPITDTRLPAVAKWISYGKLALGAAYFFDIGGFGRTIRDDDAWITGTFIALAFSDIVTVPLLRRQFKEARFYLERVEVRPRPASAGVALGMDFAFRFNAAP